MDLEQYDLNSLKKKLREVVKSHSRLVIKGRNITLKSRCAGGGYGDVYQASLRISYIPPRKRPVAVKELRGNGESVNWVRIAISLAREVQIWARLSHPNVLELLGYCLDEKKGKAWLISPYMPKGSLEKFIEGNPMDHALRLQLAVGVAKGLAYLHEEGICHGDIKPANILVTDHQTAVITDFGISRLVNGAKSGLTTSKAVKRTFLYSSPELVGSEEPQSFQSDVWAFGCVAVEVLSGVPPYSDVRQIGLLAQAIMKGLTPVKLETLKLPDTITGLVQKCWFLGPLERPNMAECVLVLDGFRWPYDPLSSQRRHTPYDQSVEAIIDPVPAANQVVSPVEQDTPHAPDIEVQPKQLLAEDALSPSLSPEFEPWTVMVSIEGIPDLSPYIKKYPNAQRQWSELGEVYMGNYTVLEGNEPLSVALMLPDMAHTADVTRRRFIREVRLWFVLKHKNINPLIGTFFDKQGLHMVSPWRRQGDVLSLLKAKKLSSADLDKILLGVSTALCYLHDEGYVYGDLKMGVVLFNDDGEPLLTHFGLSKGEDTSVKTSTGPEGRSLPWAAPEILMGEPKSKSSDVYAFGMMIVETLTFNEPFPKYTTVGSLVLAVMAGKRPDREDVDRERAPHYWESLWGLAEMCWHQDPTARPTIHQVHSMLTDVIASV